MRLVAIHAYRALLLILALLAVGSAAVAAPDSKGPAAPESAARAEFDQRLTQWKALLAELRALRQRFSPAGGITDEERRDAGRTFFAKLKEGEGLLEQVVAAAEAAYLADKGSDPEVTRFLVEVARDEAMRDNYEVAGRVSRLLVDNGVSQQKLIELAGVAAFHTNDLEAADKYLKQAAQAGKLSQNTQQLLPQLAYEKSAWEREKKLRAAEAKADDLPRKLETTHGDIVLELFENEAPNTVANFISLVEKGFYNNLTFHRVLAGFVAQGGCPNGDGTSGPGYTIRGEAKDEKTYRRHFRGSLSMALGDSADSGGSQFFITFVPTNSLDGSHTVFGRVIEGLDVLSRLQRRDPQSSPNSPGDTILKATVIRKRDHKYEPERLQPPANRAGKQIPTATTRK